MPNNQQINTIPFKRILSHILDTQIKSKVFILPNTKQAKFEPKELH